MKQGMDSLYVKTGKQPSQYGKRQWIKAVEV